MVPKNTSKYLHTVPVVIGLIHGLTSFTEGGLVHTHGQGGSGGNSRISIRFTDVYRLFPQPKKIQPVSSTVFHLWYFPIIIQGNKNDSTGHNSENTFTQFVYLKLH